MKQKFKIIQILIIFFSLISIDLKSKDIGYKIDPDFLLFWNKFQKAVINIQKQKVAEMTNFPLNGFDEGFYNIENDKIYKNNADGFIKYGFNEIFSKWSIKRFKKITNFNNKKISKSVYFKFTNIRELLNKGFLNDFIPKESEGYQLEIYDNSTPDGEFNEYFYFIKVNGVYKFYSYLEVD